MRRSHTRARSPIPKVPKISQHQSASIRRARTTKAHSRAGHTRVRPTRIAHRSNRGRTDHSRSRYWRTRQLAVRNRQLHRKRPRCCVRMGWRDATPRGAVAKIPHISQRKAIAIRRTRTIECHRRTRKAGVRSTGIAHRGDSSRYDHRRGRHRRARQLAVRNRQRHRKCPSCRVRMRRRRPRTRAAIPEVPHVGQRKAITIRRRRAVKRHHGPRNARVRSAHAAHRRHRSRTYHRRSCHRGSRCLAIVYGQRHRVGARCRVRMGGSHARSRTAIAKTPQVRQLQSV